MSIVSSSYKQMLHKSGPCRILRRETISPDQNPDIFNAGFKEEGVFGGPSRAYVNSIVNSLNLSSEDKINMRLVLAEAITNAIERGNKSNTSLHVSIKLLEGKLDYIIRIQDSGAGFDYDEKVRKLRAGEVYYERGGSGLGALEIEELEASFEGTGNILNIRKKKQRSWD